MADGSVTIGVNLDAKSAITSIQQLKSKLQSVGSSVKSTFQSEQFQSAFDKLKSTGTAALNSVGSAAKTAAKAGLAAAGAAATTCAASIVGVGKAALDSYAKYEQMVGGVDKLFGTGSASTVEEYAESLGKSVSEVQGEFDKLTAASQTVQDNAAQAFKTAGMSANDYMENVTGISASLINSLGGDTTKAAAQADVAMRAISDNANTFGTDINNIVQTYQSLARGNYAMLDNLKLGYGGTKTELQRLIKDANSYAKTHKDVAQEVGANNELQADSFSDVVTAIELIQRKQNIAGTTAREAATTIEGSVLSMQSAWSNWLTELGKDDADMETLTSELVESIITAASNIIPRIGTILSSVGNTLSEQLPKIGEMIQEALEDVDVEGMGQTLIDGLGDAATGVRDVFTSIDWGGVGSTIIEGITGVVNSIANYISQNGAQILAAVVSVIAQVAASIVTHIPDILSSIANLGASILDSIAGVGTELSKSFDTSFTEMCEKVDETTQTISKNADAWKESCDSAATAASTVSSTYGHYDGLLERLDSIVDKSGKVKKGHEQEAETIAGALNSALGTNIKVRDGAIEKYQSEKKEIEELIAAKKAEALADAYQSEYEDALKSREEALSNLVTANEAVTAAEREKTSATQEFNDAVAKSADEMLTDALEEKADEATKKWEEAKNAASSAKSTYDEMNNTVSTYDEAQAKINEGDYSGAVTQLQTLGSAAKTSASELASMGDTEKLEAMKGNIKQYAEEVSLASSDMVNGVKENLGNSVTELAEAGGNVSYYIAYGIKNNSGEVVMSGKEVYSKLKKSLTPDDSLRVLGGKTYKQYIKGLKSDNGSAAKAAGKKVSKSYASGISGGAANAKAKSVATSTAKSLKNNSGFKSAGKSNMTSATSGIQIGAKALISKSQAASKDSAEKMKSVNFNSVGTNAMSGATSGVNSGASSLINAAANAARNALQAAKNALGIHSPSRVFRDEVGVYIPAGIAKGIEKASKQAENASAKSTKKVLKAAKAELKSLKKYVKKHGGDVSKATAAYWLEIATKAKNGSNVQKTAFKNMKAAAKDYGDGLQYKIVSEYYDKIAAKADKTADKAKKGSKARKKALKEEKAAYKSSIAQAKKYADTLNLGDEREYWEGKVKLYKEAGEAGKEYYKEAKEQLKDTKQQIKEAAAEAKENLFGVKEATTSSLADIKSNLEDTISSLQDTYKQAVESTKSSIESSLGFFTEFTSEGTGSIETLIGNMRTQADAATRYANVVASLQNKLGDDATGFFSYLTDAGISSLTDLETINNATAEELDTLLALYKEREEQAGKAAATINADAYQTMVDGITDAQNEALASAKESWKAYKETMKELGKSVSDAVKAQYKENLEEINNLGSEGLTLAESLKDSFENVFSSDIVAQTEQYAQFTTSALEAAEKAAEEAEDATESVTETVKTGTTLITQTVEKAMSNQYSAVASATSAMESQVASTVSRIQSMMATISAAQSSANATAASTSSTLSSLNLQTASVNWHANGGVFNKPSVIGIGEAGVEAAIPLQGQQMQPFAQAIGQNMNMDEAIGSLIKALPSIIKNSTPNSMSVNKREFARLVREV